MGPVTGFDKVDNEHSGAIQPGLHVVSAGSGVGKSAFCLQIAGNCGCPAIYVACDGGMTPQVILRRIIARVTETRLDVLMNCKLRDTGIVLTAARMKELAREAVAAVPDLIIVDGITTFPEPDWICREADKARKAANSEYVLIIIDSMHSWAAGIKDDRGRPVEEYERLPLGIDGLRKVSKTLNCPILSISEQSKEANKKADKGENPGLSAPAGNRVIEYQADSVMALISTGPEDAFGLLPVTMTMNKNRNGAKNSAVKLTFDGKLQRFAEV